MKRHVILFSHRFEVKVRTGLKIQTIRPKRIRQISIGDSLSLRKWTGKPYRSKQEILAAAVATRVEPVTITQVSVSIGSKTIVCSQPEGEKHLDSLAKADGFDHWADMAVWFFNRYPMPFHGELIGWDLE